MRGSRCGARSLPRGPASMLGARVSRPGMDARGLVPGELRGAVRVPARCPVPGLWRCGRYRDISQMCPQRCWKGH